MTSSAGVDEAFPWPRATLFRPPPQYARLRDEEPVAQVAFQSRQPVWVVTRHNLFREVLTHAFISSEHSHPGFPPIFPIPQQRKKGGVRPKLTYSGMDRPEHTLHRRMIADEFTRKRIEAVRTRVQEIVDEQVQAMLNGPRPVDLVRALAEPVPSLVVTELLGVPQTQRLLVQELSRIVFRIRSSRERAKSAAADLGALVSSLLATKEVDPAEDLVSRLIVRYRKAGMYDRSQMIHFVGALIIAGHETTVNMIALGAVTLLEHPKQLGELKTNPRLFRQAVEELLRYLSIADLVTARVAVGDIELGGVTIRSGEGVIALGAAADHDPAVFDQPERLNIHRDASHHVAFGYGIHKCLGQHLARLELEVVFRTLFARMPGLRLAVAAESLRFEDSGVLQGVSEVPVTW